MTDEEQAESVKKWVKNNYKLFEPAVEFLQDEGYDKKEAIMMVAVLQRDRLIAAMQPSEEEIKNRMEKMAEIMRDSDQGFPPDEGFGWL